VSLCFLRRYAPDILRWRRRVLRLHDIQRDKPRRPPRLLRRFFDSRFTAGIQAPTERTSPRMWESCYAQPSSPGRSLVSILDHNGDATVRISKIAEKAEITTPGTLPMRGGADRPDLPIVTPRLESSIFIHTEIQRSNYHRSFDTHSLMRETYSPSDISRGFPSDDIF
jgi:hypothetical protein